MRKVLLMCAGFSALSIVMFTRHAVNASKVENQNSYEQVATVLTAADTEIAPVLVQEAVPLAPVPFYIDVMPGDTLVSIAAANNVTSQRLFDANAEIADPSLLNIGQKIRVPYIGEVLPTRPMPAPKPVPVSVNKTVVSNAPAVASGSVWDQMSLCEAGGVWSRNSGNGYYGGLQFSLSTWRAVGGQGLPSDNSREEQIARAEILLARSGWGQWPSCARKLGLL